MRLIKMTGGLGNQMFIYAFYLQMKERFPDVRIDLSDMVHYHAHYGYELHRVFHLPPEEFCINQSLKKVVEFLFFKTIIERKQKSREVYTRKYLWPLIYYKGFYQSEKYFKPIEPVVRKAFTFDEGQANRLTRQLLQQISGDENAVSLHVRRGDYLLPKFWQNMGSVCRLPYYRNAIQEINKRVNAPTYYVFSDDMAWVKENLSLENAVYVGWNTGEDSWQDMMLMSRCRHHIICNSTFSWWGGWLNPRKDKCVVAPEHWFSHIETPDIYPEEWIKVAIH